MERIVWNGFILFPGLRRRRGVTTTTTTRMMKTDEVYLFVPPTAEMNKWRAVSFLAIPACAGFGVYTLANAHHSHNEHPSYSYLKIRNREQFPWGGDCGLFEYRDDCK